ncbi:MAG: lysophospholipid acyltransferase family protein [Candidatus Goldiibacteriota bacterium]
MKNKRLKYIRNTFLIIFFQTVRFVVFFIPHRAGAVLFGAIAKTGYYLLARQREILFMNLDIVYGEAKTYREKKRLALENFRNYGIGAFEFMKFSHWSPGRIASLVKETQGLEPLKEAVSRGKGVIAVTAHMSNWEIQSIYLSHAGFNIGGIAKKIFDERLDRIINATRRKNGVKIFDRSAVTKTMIEGLKKDMVLGILADQDTSVDSVYVPFLDKPAKTPAGPAVLAKKLKLPVMVIYAYRRGDGYYGIKANGPFDISDKTIEQTAELYNKILSDAIRKHPEQWVWLHRRFRMTEEFRYEKNKNTGKKKAEE